MQGYQGLEKGLLLVGKKEKKRRSKRRRRKKRRKKKLVYLRRKRYVQKGVSALFTDLNANVIDATCIGCLPVFHDQCNVFNQPVDCEQSYTSSYVGFLPI